MWNPFSKESVLRDLRDELRKIEEMDQELLPTLERIAAVMPDGAPAADMEPFQLSQKLLNTDSSVRHFIEALEGGHITVGRTRAGTAFLAGNVREFRRQLTQLKRKKCWVDPAASKVKV